LQGHSNTVTSVLFSHDDAFALTASDDCTVKVCTLALAPAQAGPSGSGLVLCA
jgi:WD40 repeat protein